MTFWWFLAVLVPVAAVVAYAGDAVAKRVGKRHWRLFGLRPRATGTLVAVVTGVVIAVSAFAAFFLLARDARETILLAERVRAERDSLQQEVARYQQVVADLRAQASQTLAERNQLAGERRRLEELLGAMEKRLGRTTDELDQSRQALQQLKATTTQQQQALIAANNQQKRLQVERQTLQDRERYLAQQAAQAQSQLNRLIADQQQQLVRAFNAEQKVLRLEERTRLLEKEKLRFEQDLAFLAAQRKQAEEIRQQLEQQKQELSQQRDALRASLLQTQRDEAELKARLSRLQNQVFTLEASRTALRSGVESLVGRILLSEKVVLPGSEQQAVAEALTMAEERVRGMGLSGSVVVERPKFPLVVRQGVVLVRPRGVTSEGLMQLGVEYRTRERKFSRGEVLVSLQLNLPSPANESWRNLEGLWAEATMRLKAADWVPEKLDLAPDSSQILEVLAQMGRLKGAVRVGIVAEVNLYPTEVPQLVLRVLP